MEKQEVRNYMIILSSYLSKKNLCEESKTVGDLQISVTIGFGNEAKKSVVNSLWNSDKRVLP